MFGGELGGPMEALGPLIGENLGVERAPIEFSSEGGIHRLKVGEAIARFSGRSATFIPATVPHEA